MNQGQAAMRDILRLVQEVNTLVGEIGPATAQQTAGIAQVSTTVRQRDRATHRNGALVEASAATADSLRHQAGGLVEAAGRFRLCPDCAHSSLVARAADACCDRMGL